MDSINLWECITSSKLEGKIIREQLTELGNPARWNGQEISLRATEEGWKIRIFSCYSDDNNCEIVILIPKDNNKSVQILKDRSGYIEYHH